MYLPIGAAMAPPKERDTMPNDPKHIFHVESLIIPDAYLVVSVRQQDAHVGDGSIAEAEIWLPKDQGPIRRDLQFGPRVKIGGNPMWHGATQGEHETWGVCSRPADTAADAIAECVAAARNDLAKLERAYTTRRQAAETLAADAAVAAGELGLRAGTPGGQDDE